MTAADDLAAHTGTRRQGGRTPYYADEFVTLYHGDCFEIMPELADWGADLVLADPPYNVGKEYDEHFDKMPPDEYETWTRDWFETSRDIAPRQVVFCGHGNLGMWHRVRRPSAIGCWYKPGNGASSIIGWEEWEPWLYWHGGNKGLLGGSSVIRAPLDTAGNEMAARAGHPCPKPVALITKLIVKCRSDAVIDPFVGSGTTLVAAKKLGVRAIGIERSERYCEIAARRLSQGVLDFAAASAADTDPGPTA